MSSQPLMSHDMSPKSTVSYNQSHQLMDDVRDQQKRVQQTFHIVSQLVIILFVGLLAYYNWLLLSPHLDAIFWSILWAIFLSRPQKYMLAAFATFDRQCPANVKHSIAAAVVAVAVVFALRSSVINIIVIAVIAMLCLFLLYAERNNLVALILMSAVVFTMTFPLVFFLKTCVDESKELAVRLSGFISASPQIDTLLLEVKQSEYYKQGEALVESYGYSIPEFDISAVKEKAQEYVTKFSDTLTAVLTSTLTSISSVGSSIGNFVVTIMSFLSFLYMLLDTGSSFGTTLAALSPFTPQDNTRLIKVLQQSLRSTFLCSGAIGIVHMITTYIAFYSVGIDLCLVIAFCDGIASMLPIFSSWIIWLPAIGGLAIAGKTLEAGILVVVQLVLVYGIDGWIYSQIPGNASIVGLSLALGVYTFGASGVVLGPLLAGVTMTVLDIYASYQHLHINEESTLIAMSKPDHTQSHHAKVLDHAAAPIITTYNGNSSQETGVENVNKTRWFDENGKELFEEDEVYNSPGITVTAGARVITK